MLLFPMKYLSDLIWTSSRENESGETENDIITVESMWDIYVYY